VTAWCLTTSPDNVAATAARGWTVQGIKSRRGRTARDIHPGDRLVYYATGVSAFTATVEVTGEVFEDHELIWHSKGGSGVNPEDYPWRFPIRPELVLPDPDTWVPADDLRGALEFPQKWPEANWKLAFQGNIRAWPEHDYQLVLGALREAASRGSARPSPTG